MANEFILTGARLETWKPMKHNGEAWNLRRTTLEGDMWDTIKMQMHGLHGLSTYTTWKSSLDFRPLCVLIDLIPIRISSLGHYVTYTVEISINYQFTSAMWYTDNCSLHSLVCTKPLSKNYKINKEQHKIW